MCLGLVALPAQVACVSAGLRLDALLTQFCASSHCANNVRIPKRQMCILSGHSPSDYFGSSLQSADFSQVEGAEGACASTTLCEGVWPRLHVPYESTAAINGRISVPPALQVFIQRADPTIAEEACAALWQPPNGGHRMAGAVHAAGTQVSSSGCCQLSGFAGSCSHAGIISRPPASVTPFAIGCDAFQSSSL
jgi:hypothetical protein